MNNRLQNVVRKALGDKIDGPLGVSIHLDVESFLVRCSRGLQSLLADELLALGFGQAHNQLRVFENGVLITAPTGTFYRVLQLSRLAERIIMLPTPRELTDVRSPATLYGHVVSMPWGNFINFSAGMRPPIVKVSWTSNGLEKPPEWVRDKIVEQKVLAALNAIKSHFICRNDNPNTRDISSSRVRGAAHPSSFDIDSDPNSLEAKKSLQYPNSVPPPTIHVMFRSNGYCHIGVDASGFLGFRGFRAIAARHLKASVADHSHRAQNTPSTAARSAATVGPSNNTSNPQRGLLNTHYAAIILKSPILEVLSALQKQEELVVWDPFCGDGALLLELLTVVLGQKAIDVERRRFPCTSFPSYDTDILKDAVSECQLRPHPNWRQLKLFGSDGFHPRSNTLNHHNLSSGRHVQAVENLDKFMSTLTWTEKSSNGCEVEGLVRKNKALLTTIQKNIKFAPPFANSTQAAALKPKRCFVLTVIPSGASSNNGRAMLNYAYRSFAGLMNSRTDWTGSCIAVSAASDAFKQRLGDNWDTSLKFELGDVLGGGPPIQLMKWCGPSSTM